MRDVNILHYVASSLWALDEDKWSEIVPILVRHVRGDKLSAEEIQARIGAPSQPATWRGNVAVIPIRGMIAHRGGSMDESSGGTSAESIGKMVRAAAADSSVGTIVYDVDSPGGTVPGIPELGAQMFALRGQKKQIAVANSTMASAAYWLSSQADEVVAIPSAGNIGSIGVFSAHQDLSAALEKEGIKVTLIKAGKFKTEGNPFQPLTEEGLAFRQARVDSAYADFVGAVARGRSVTASAVKHGFGEGRALSAQDALTAGLIDRIATMDDVLGELVSGPVSVSGMRATGSLADDRIVLDRERRMWFV